MSLHCQPRSSSARWTHLISPRRHCLMYILAVLIVFSNVRVSDSQLLSAYEQAYGSWKIQLTRNIFGRRWYLEKLEKRDGTRSSIDFEDKIRNGDLQLLFPVLSSEAISDSSLVYCTKSVRSVSCLLNLQRNGKFTIHIDDGDLSGTAIPHVASDDANNKSQPRNKIDTAADREPATASIYHSPLRGEWFITPNPYCVTDRHYDTLTLISEPRIRRAKFREGIVTERAKVEFRCKLWGRYGVGAIRNKLGLGRGREMGRMTHGTVMVVREYVNENRSRLDGGNMAKESPRREIVATFTGHSMADCNDSGKENYNFKDELRCEDGNEDDTDLYE